MIWNCSLREPVECARDQSPGHSCLPPKQNVYEIKLFSAKIKNLILNKKFVWQIHTNN